MHFFCRLVQDPGGNDAGTMAWARVAINNGKGSDGNDRPATFIDIKAWKAGVNILRSCSKGSPLTVDGRLMQETYVDRKDGTEKVRYFVACNAVYPVKYQGRSDKGHPSDAYGGTSNNSWDDPPPGDDEIPF